jgi:hypothetical protein
MVSQVFALEVDGKPTLAFEAQNMTQARELCKERWLRADLSWQKSNRTALCDAGSKLSVRRASVEEATLFGQAAASAKPSDDWCWPIWSNWMVSRQACRHPADCAVRGKSAAT